MAVKPSGQIALNPNHPLASSVVALLVIEDDGTARELISGQTATTTTKVGAGGDIGTDADVFVNMLAELSILDASAWTAGTQWTEAAFCDVMAESSATQNVTQLGTRASFGGSNGHRLLRKNWTSTNGTLQLYGGWSGNGPSSSAGAFAMGGTPGIVAGIVSDTTASPSWGASFYSQGTIAASVGGVLNNPNDANNGSSTYIGLGPMSNGTTTGVAYYSLYLDKDASQSELDALDADPWDLVMAAGGGGTPTEIAAEVAQLTKTAFASSVNAAKSIQTLLASLTVSAKQASLGVANDISATTDTIALSPLVSSVLKGQTIAATTQSLSLTKFAATTSLDRDVAAALASVGVTKLSALVSLNRDILPPLVSLSITGNASTVSFQENIDATKATIALGEYLAVINNQEVVGIANLRRGTFTFLHRRTA